MLRNSVKTFCLQKFSKSSLKAEAASVTGVGRGQMTMALTWILKFDVFYHIFNKKGRFVSFDKEK